MTILAGGNDWGVVRDAYVDLEPSIHRQRLVIEGRPAQTVASDQIVEYLSKLSTTLGMTTLIEPVTHRSDQYGWAGWIHWETSGAHFYAWERPLFFSSDIYPCKSFDALDAVSFTQDFFQSNSITYREF